MQTPAFSIGDRVRIAETYHWAKGATGTIAHFALPESRPETCSRQVDSLEGALTFYWVRFDEPQTEIEGESGYLEGEIDDRYLSAF